MEHAQPGTIRRFDVIIGAMGVERLSANDQAKIQEVWLAAGAAVRRHGQLSVGSWR
jgi:hypothetical protein